ncbi:type II toxin-antitoxin system RatA family toxin [Kitasatospora sp. NPDC048296]|uniref:type II toxin-antitoxin system RatA family toxin n=1 Tax=Kitasatospora sp. NPDC048296 TaxID=3364048 RepID=UPI00371E95C8
MRQFSLQADVRGLTPDEVYRRVCDFESFAALAPEVIRRTSVALEDDGARTSHWEVSFYEGILRWTERDVCDPVDRAITFTQTSGDLADFFGSWRVAPDGDGAVVRFHCDFDLGMPVIADIIEPIALAAFDSTMTQLVRGLFGAGTPVETSVAAPSRPEAVAR